jgi:hypothetical protein
VWNPGDVIEPVAAAPDAATGDRVRREGEAVIGRVEDRAAPFSEPWPGWRPDPAWCRPELPADWAVVQE